MPTSIDDLALLSDLQTAALVDRRGAVVWACLPRFDSGACFASLLGDDIDHGVWRISPTDPKAEITRRYRQGLVLETTWVTETGTIQVVDFMPVRNRIPDLIRLVIGVEGTVECESELSLRFDYGSIVPWVRRDEHGDLLAVAGPDRVRLHTPVDHHGQDMHSRAEFTVSAGDRVPFVLDWRPSHEPVGPHIDAEDALEETVAFWNDWIAEGDYDGDYATEVHQSLAVLKGLTYLPTGGMIAAPTTSLPEVVGGGRNWDYRFCWLRDTTYTLLALLESGHVEEAEAWRNWLLRAVAGDPRRVQIMYGLAGERRLTEQTVDWLPGYQDSSPVRIGNGAYDQFQLDVFGEVMDALHHARAAGITTDEDAWNLQKLLMDVLAERWREPDEGIWEVRGERRHFTHSKVMAWVAARPGRQSCASSSASRDRSTTGGSCATTSATRSCARAWTTGASSRSPTAPTRSTPASC